MKIAILMDSIMNRGGAERIVLLQAQHLNADIITGRYLPESTFSEFKDCRIKVLLKRKLPQRIGSLLTRYKFARLKLKEYDLCIFHGGTTLEASRKNQPNIWYCHAPTRWVYDMYEDELEKTKGLRRILFKIMRRWIKKRDQRAVQHVNTILANSKNVQQRVAKFYNREATVNYPPVETSQFRWRGQKDFYLSTARLDPIKRVDLLIKAFQKLPDKKLVIVSTGPDMERLRELAKDCKNITFAGKVSDQELKNLYGTCIATITTAYKEDLGMVALESMSCGKPCITTNSGGFLETIIDKKTGLLVDPTDTAALADAIRWMTPERALKMRQDCEAQAKRFDVTEFFKKMDAAIEKTIAGTRK